MTLYYFNECKSEFNVIQGFLQWQKIKFDVCEDVKTLKYTKGKAVPVLVENELVLGVGFFAILKYLQSKGMTLC